MRAAFFGTPPAAVPSLAALASIADVPLVVTRPDKARGRSGRGAPSAVKEAAADWGLPIAQPRHVGELADLDVDVAVVVAYGQILPAPVLALPRRGFVNVHFSVLPRWRGAAPVARAILAGDATTGVSLMVLDEGMDTGPVLAREETQIGELERAGELTARLAARGASLLADYLAAYVRGDVVPEAQDDEAATLAPKLTTAEARIDRAAPADDVLRRVRAFHPRPGAWLEADGERLKVLAAAPTADAGLRPGRIEAKGGEAVLTTGVGSVALLIVQPSGKAPMPGAAWMNGRRAEPAELE